MHNINPPPSTKFRHLTVVVGVLGIAAAVMMISCATVQRTIIVPPHIEGATFVGSQTCEQCHQNITKDFHTADHARLLAKGANAQEMGCESCHGPGSVHNESGGARNTIINPRRDPETCFQCHLDKKAQFATPHHHPVESGKVSCSDCHNPHKGPVIKGGGTSIMAEQETCMQCHTAQRGPFVFEHEAIREGCTTCHNPHGTVNDKMLVQRNQNLCLKCHFQTQGLPGQPPGTVYIGAQDHTGFVLRGTCWSAGCHEAVHGSHVSSSLRF